MLLAQISDLHIKRPGALAYRRVDTAAYLERCVERLNAIEPKLDAVVVTGDEVNDGKPHPEAYLTAAARLGVDPARCVAIEDSPTGVASAEAAGCVVVAVPHHVPIAAAPTRTVVGSLTDLDVARLDAMVRERVG